MHAQIFNFAPLEDFLLAKVEEIREGKKLAEDVNTTPSHTSDDDDNDDDNEGSDDLALQALIQKG